MNQNILAKAIYDNISESENELSFKKGDILLVLEKNFNNLFGWWLCELNGKRGICPGNRLEIVTDKDSLAKNNNFYDHPTAQSNSIDNLNRSLNSDLMITSFSSHSNTLDKTCEDNNIFLSYDIPKSTKWRLKSNQKPNNLLSPSSSISSLTSSLSSNSNSAIMENGNPIFYDVPKSIAINALNTSSTIEEKNLEQKYDVPTFFNANINQLELDKALETLEKLQTDLTLSVNNMLKYVQPQWRSKDNLNAEITNELKLGTIKLNTSLHHLVIFSECALENANKASDKGLANKLRPLVKSLTDSNVFIEKSLKDIIWNCDKLVVESDQTLKSDSVKSDSLEQLLELLRTLTEDIRQISSFIQGNSKLLFKKKETNAQNDVQKESNDKCDNNKEEKAAVHQDRKEDKIEEKEIEFFNENELKINKFYGKLCIKEYEKLMDCVDEFLKSVEHNQPPKHFVENSKLIVISVHNLINMAQILYRNMDKTKMSLQCEQLLNGSNQLNELLIDCVNKIKKAAQQFPSVVAVQEMVDSVIQVSNQSRDLKMNFISLTINQSNSSNLTTPTS